MNMKRASCYLFLLAGMVVVFSGCYAAVKKVEQADKAIYNEIPNWM